MIKFIKLTECKGTIIIINVAQIEHFTLGAKGNDTYVKMISSFQDKPNELPVKGNYFFVKESMDVIWGMLITDNSKAPVLMTAEEALNYYKLKDGC